MAEGPDGSLGWVSWRMGAPMVLRLFLTLFTLKLDLRSALRQLVKNTGFSALVILVLTLAIGGTSAVFTFVNALLFQPLAGNRPQEVVRVYDKTLKPTQRYHHFSYPKFMELRAQQEVFTGLAACYLDAAGVEEGDYVRKKMICLTSWDYFSVLGVPMALGRGFLEEEGQPGGARQVILSHDAWLRRGADPSLVGQTLRVNARNYEVVGVLPRSYPGITSNLSPHYYFPLGVYDQLAGGLKGNRQARLVDSGNQFLWVTGRLRPGLSRAQAELGLQGLAAPLASAFPVEGHTPRFELGPQARAGIYPNPEPEMGMFILGSAVLVGFSLIVLLIACLNLTNMMLVKGAGRAKEMAIRLALGGQRRQLVQQMLAEGLLMSLFGTVGGLYLGQWSINVLWGSFANLGGVDVPMQFQGDYRVALVALGCGVLATLVFALGPAMKLSGQDLATELKGQGAEAAGVRRRFGWMKPMNLMVVGQMALSLAMLTGAGLMLRGAMAAAKADPGYSLKGGLVAEMDASMVQYTKEQALQAYAKVLDNLRAMPGVAHASLAYGVAFPKYTDGSEVREVLREEGSEDTQVIPTRKNRIANDYFQTLDVPLLRGREFTRSEVLQATDPAVAIIDLALAENLWPGADAIGRWIRFKGDPVPLHVVGVVPTLKDGLLNDPRPAHVYIPYGRDYAPRAFLHIRQRSPEMDLQAAMRACIQATDPRLPIQSIQTLSANRDSNPLVAGVRAGSKIFVTFGLLALFLAALGLFGVRAQVVNLRTREFGIRMSLGAPPTSIRSLVLKEGMVLGLLGLAGGFLLSLLVSRALQGLLYGVQALDPMTYLLAPALLTGVGLLASLLPALKASRVHPSEVLRRG